MLLSFDEQILLLSPCCCSVGLSLYTAAVTSGQLTGAALNPARALGPLIVYGCGKTQAATYVLAEVFGAVVAGILSGPLYGWGPGFLGNIFGQSRVTAGDGYTAAPAAVLEFL